MPRTALDRTAGAIPFDLRLSAEQRDPEGLTALFQSAFFVALLGSAERWAEADLTMPQLKVLLLLAESAGVPVNWLAARMNVSPPNITGILDRLEARGWISRSVDAQDRRVVRVEIAPPGARLLWQLCAGGADKLADGAAALEETDVAALRAGLGALLNRLGGDG